MAKCAMCDSETINDKKFCSKRCSNRSGYKSYETQKQRGIQRKEELISRAGGKCSRCGYDRCRTALSFHHLNPEDKLFPLDARHLTNGKMENIEKEFRKCILLCLNCHTELHWREQQRDSIY